MVRFRYEMLTRKIIFSLLLFEAVTAKHHLDPFPTEEIFERTPAIKAHARACVAAYGEHGSRVLFLHNRKAGGTTVRKWLGEQQICHGRFTAFVEESNVMNVTRLREPGTVFITALREPVSRIFSSFKFEGQGTFEEWVAEVQAQRGGGRRGRVWMEVQNYYIQRLSGYRWNGHGPTWSSHEEEEGEEAVDYPDWEALYDRALAVMNSFDVVFLVDEFHKPGTLQSGAANMGIPLPTHPAGGHHHHHNSSSSSSSSSSAAASSPVASASSSSSASPVEQFGHARVSRYVQGPTPQLNLTDEEYAKIRDWNKWDIKLFEAAKERAQNERQHFTSSSSSLEASPTSSRRTRRRSRRRRLLTDQSLAASSSSSFSSSSSSMPRRPPLDSCAQDVKKEKWCEPIERLRGKVPCRHRHARKQPQSPANALRLGSS